MQPLIYHNPNCGLINRLIVVTGRGVRLCRPPEQVLERLNTPIATFTRENGEVVTHSKNT